MVQQGQRSHVQAKHKQETPAIADPKFKKWASGSRKSVETESRKKHNKDAQTENDERKNKNNVYSGWKGKKRVLCAKHSPKGHEKLKMVAM